MFKVKNFLTSKAQSKSHYIYHKKNENYIKRKLFK